MDPPVLNARREVLRERLLSLRAELAALRDAYRALPESGMLIDTPGIGALTTPAYCIAGAAEVFEEALIELDAAEDALGRAGDYTAQLRQAVLDS